METGEERSYKLNETKQLYRHGVEIKGKMLLTGRERREKVADGWKGL